MSIKTSQFQFDTKEAQQLIRMSIELANTLDDILEKHTSYSKKFLRGLEISLTQAKAAKLKKITSLGALK